MNWSEIKSTAKEKIKGNKWDIWWPMLIIGLISSLLDTLFVPKVDVQNMQAAYDQLSAGSSVLGICASIILSIITAGYIKYILDFIRTGKFDHTVIVQTIKNKWLELLIAAALTTIIIGVGLVFFIIPGIILALAYTFVFYIIVDSDTTGIDAMKKSREMMKGYKWDFFAFILSFIGWVILSIFTLFILWVWLMPYMTVACALYYEKLKEIKA